MMNIIRLYIYPLFLGFVIVPLLVWPMVVALAACIITLSFLGEMLFSIPLMIRRISLLQLQLWLSAEYALFFCVMCCVGWQFTRRTQSELKSRLHCWLVFAPVYLWLILWNIIFLHRASENCVAGKYPQFLSACCLATPEFFAILASAVDGFYRSNKRTAWFCVGILLPVVQQK